MRGNTLTFDTQFWGLPATQAALTAWINSALEEDTATRDLTAPLLKVPGSLGDEDKLAGTGVITAKQCGVICGLEAVRKTFEILDPNLEVTYTLKDGSVVSKGDRVFVANSAAVNLLAGERTALNICGHLSGIATATADLVKIAEEIAIFDTRKTIPGIRKFQKYAVTVGGGKNHRMSLSEFPMFKENHRALLQHLYPSFSADPQMEVAWIKEALLKNRYQGPISIEVEDEESLRACLIEGIEMILVDNVSPGELGEWLKRAQADGIPIDKSRLEASGGIDIQSLKGHAESGVGRISVGSITHSSAIFDLSMSVEPFEGRREISHD